MIALAFAERNRKELMRDPLTIAFGLGFPLVLLFLLSLIQRNIPIPMFEIRTLTPGIASFGLTFVALFSATLTAKDRAQSFMMRLQASPMPARSFILGYMLPLIPLSAAQMAVCYLAAAALGFRLDGNALLSLLTLMPAALMYIAIGLICGALLTDRQVGGICGAVLTNLCAWLSGIWFDLSLLGEGAARVAEALPFANAVTAARAAASGSYAAIPRPLLITSSYALILILLAVWIFQRKMKKGTL